MTRRDKLLQLVESDIQQGCSDYQALRGLMQSLHGHLLECYNPQISLANQDILALVDAIRNSSAPAIPYSSIPSSRIEPRLAPTGKAEWPDAARTDPRRVDPEGCDYAQRWGIA